MMPRSCAYSSASGHLARVLERGLERQGAGQHGAGDELHRQRPIFHAVNRGDMRMVQRGEHLSLALESRHAVRIALKRFRQYFERHIPLQPGVSGAIHLSHAAGADWRDDLVGAQASSWGESHRVSNNSTSPGGFHNVAQRDFALPRPGTARIPQP